MIPAGRLGGAADRRRRSGRRMRPPTGLRRL